MDFLLNSTRKIDNDQAKEHAFGTEESLEERLAVCFVNPKDFEELNLVPSLHIKISNNERSVIVNVEKDEKVHEGIILMPVSIWSNRLTLVKKKELFNKNIRVYVEATRDPITKYKDIIEDLRR